MAGYGWTSYDIWTGGAHVVNDTGNEVNLVTQFSKPAEGNWGLRVTSLPREDAASHEQTSLFFYIGMEGAGATLDCVNNFSGGFTCTGRTCELGHFNVLVLDRQSDNSTFKKTSVKSLTVAQMTSGKPSQSCLRSSNVPLLTKDCWKKKQDKVISTFYRRLSKEHLNLTCYSLPTSFLRR